MELVAIGKKAMEFFTIVAFVSGLGWVVAKPKAEEFIKETVKERLTTLEETADQIQKKLRDQEISGIRTESDLSTVKANQREMQEDLKTIIQKLIDR